jgi:hypothetical protein
VRESERKMEEGRQKEREREREKYRQRERNTDRQREGKGERERGGTGSRCDSKNYTDPSWGAQTNQPACTHTHKDTHTHINT